MRVTAILDNIDRAGISLPMFQRGYVWKRRQVKELMQSLYHEFPVGGLLVWETRAEDAEIRTSGQVPVSGAISLLLDGQQRVTSLYGMIRGEEPPFFDGDPNAFTGLHFNLDTEEFEFYSDAKMRLDPRWVSVTELFERGAAARKIRQLSNSGAYSDEQLDAYQDRAQKIVNIQNVEFPVQTITSSDIDTDLAVEIFNRVNSGGRKLSKGDLALARIGGRWPEARNVMRQRLDEWKNAGFSANQDWLLRCIAVTTTDTAEYEGLANVPITSIQQGLDLVVPAVDCLLEATRAHLGMDTDKVHNSKQAFPAMVKYLVNNAGDFPDETAKAKLLHWYISASIWGRFSGPTETVINQDLRALADDDPIDGLWEILRQSQGGREIIPEHFDAVRINARFYPLLHIMSRVGGAKDWGTGQRLPDHNSGEDAALELHHIFPKKVLRDSGVSANDANNFGNLAFQTRQTNRAIRDRRPADYMPEIAEHQPGALESQWVPNDPRLWEVENYQEFLAERRRLLAKAANEFLESLRKGELPSAVGTISGVLDDDDEEAILDGLNRFVTIECNLLAGELGYEISDTKTGEIIAVLDLAWPNGLQEGFSEPVAVLIDEENSVRIAANDAGFRRVFTIPEEFRHYVQQEILGEENEADDDTG